MASIMQKYSSKKEFPTYEVRPTVLNTLWNQLHLGTLYAMWGGEGSGKTTLYCQVIKYVCQKYKLKVLIVDVEKAFNEQQQKAFGLYEFIESGQIVILTCNNFKELEEIVIALPSSEFNIIMIDSWSAVKPFTPDTMRVTDIRPGLQAMQEGTVISKLKQYCYDNNIAGFILAHARANIQIGHVNMHAPANKMAGSFSLKHWVEVITEITTHGKVKNPDDEKDIVGIEITLVTTKNKWTAPFKPIREKFYYGIGIDGKMSLIDKAIELGVITTGRTWRIQGLDDTFNRKTILVADMSVFQHIKAQVELAEAQEE